MYSIHTWDEKTNTQRCILYTPGLRQQEDLSAHAADVSETFDNSSRKSASETTPNLFMHSVLSYDQWRYRLQNIGMNVLYHLYVLQISRSISLSSFKEQKMTWPRYWNSPTNCRQPPLHVNWGERLDTIFVFISIKLDLTHLNPLIFLFTYLSIMFLMSSTLALVHQGC